ncbi:ExeA family protein [Stutzerimonas kirkiae]|uniref:AAA family ATPase n=1 Tax=Stutzerimonas kirkiae TaxID=2211392 RepID=A0A4Q9RE41_9GAMM|nr:AAA family ATPase [Stutzerimonas kirkiae]TBU99948.1 AAA family ATPase [Stutzerimonas kirkiae]TBV05654.1 AAA family ATPase [Stutzerimonas kirkiae]TBV10605.1 AAA family ATPase [Stutzerimonas kirkiae]TBV17460.1 AAA family ATPase [Stutzerimonas kirkiae]
MYEAFFGLREKPFALTPNTDFLVQLAPYQACLNLLRVALGEGEGFIKVTGEVGTGKTLLCRALLNELDSERYQVAWLPNPALNPMGLRQALAHELHIADVEELDNHGLLSALHQRLIELAAAGKSTVVLIDEAQALPSATLEGLRLLTNLETEQRKLLQVVLFGQPELDATLAREDFRQLRQRITFSYRLRPLDVRDASRYLQERLAVAGYRGEPLFSGASVRLLVRGSGGIPRLLNILANKCLMAAYGEGARQVAPRHVRRALEDTEGARRSSSRLSWWLLAGGVSVCLLLAVWPWLSQVREVLP